MLRIQPTKELLGTEKSQQLVKITEMIPLRTRGRKILHKSQKRSYTCGQGQYSTWLVITQRNISKEEVRTKVILQYQPGTSAAVMGPL